MGPIVVPVALLVLAMQDPGTPSPKRPQPPSEIVLVGEAEPTAAAFGLGDGGVADRRAPGLLRFTEHGCVTPGGIEIECREEGVKLTFAKGRELLLAPDGFLHLRDGELAGPFAGGAELRLGDGALVRVVLNASQRCRLRDVVVVFEDHALQPWRRGERSAETPRVVPWPGLRFACVGDGGDVYRTIALGPLITLDRVLTPKDRQETTPREHLALVLEPLHRSMQRMPRQHTTSDAAVRGAVSAVAAVANVSDGLFVPGASLQRIERDRLRWTLRGGYELELQIDGATPRIGLYAGMTKLPMVEWNLSVSPAAFLGNPYDDQPGGKRWYGNGIRLVPVVADLQAREQLFERAQAVDVLRRMERSETGKRRRR